MVSGISKILYMLSIPIIMLRYLSLIVLTSIIPDYGDYIKIFSKDSHISLLRRFRKKIVADFGEFCGMEHETP
jgi:hypothetical protein